MRTDKGQVVRGTDQCYAIEQLFHVVGRNHKSVNKEEKVDSLGLQWGSGATVKFDSAE